MKINYPQVLLSGVVGLSSWGSAQAQSSTPPLRFIQPTSCQESGGVPPQLSCTFKIDCSSKFIELIRRDVEETAATVIHIGGLITEDPLLDCKGTLRDVEARAGTTFAGRAYEIKFIETSAQDEDPGDGTSSCTGDTP